MSIADVDLSGAGSAPRFCWAITPHLQVHQAEGKRRDRSAGDHPRSRRVHRGAGRPPSAAPAPKRPAARCATDSLGEAGSLQVRAASCSSRHSAATATLSASPTQLPDGPRAGGPVAGTRRGAPGAGQRGARQGQQVRRRRLQEPLQGVLGVQRHPHLVLLGHAAAGRRRRAPSLAAMKAANSRLSAPAAAPTAAPWFPAAGVTGLPASSAAAAVRAAAKAAAPPRPRWPTRRRSRAHPRRRSEPQRARRGVPNSASPSDSAAPDPPASPPRHRAAAPGVLAARRRETAARPRPRPPSACPPMPWPRECASPCPAEQHRVPRRVPAAERPGARRRATPRIAGPRPGHPASRNAASRLAARPRQPPPRRRPRPRPPRPAAPAADHAAAAAQPPRPAHSGPRGPGRDQ